MLLLLDLDNTLIDRTAAFARWAARYVPAQGGGQSDVSWLIEADRDGYEPRERLAARIRERLSPATDVGEVLQELRAGMVAQVVFDPEVGAALTEAVAAGWVPAAGLQTVWLRRGREWAADLPYRPTCAADDCAAAIRGLVACGR